jgi:hypothetical protein
LRPVNHGRILETMRRSTVVLAAVVLLSAAPAMFAAPTCQNRSGVTVRCATPAAMPVGWTLALDARLPLPASANPTQALELICLLGVFFSLMARHDGR